MCLQWQETDLIMSLSLNIIIMIEIIEWTRLQTIMPFQEAKIMIITRDIKNNQF